VDECDDDVAAYRVVPFTQDPGRRSDDAPIDTTVPHDPRTPMPQHKSAKKRMRQNEKRRERNQSHKSRVRSKIKQLRSLEDKDAAQEMLNDVKGELDRLASKNIIHKNKAANYKSKLEKHVNGLA